MIHIIPAIDVIGGKCVRLSQGAYESVKVYDEDPVSVAKGFEELGIRKLHLVDLEGAKAKHMVNQGVLKAIAHETNLEIDFGGGIKSDEDAQLALELGACQINIGSMAVTHPDLLKTMIRHIGTEKIILGADVKDEKIAIHGWKETSEHSLWDFLAEYQKAGIKYVVCTDVSKDGMLQGPSFELYEKIINKFSGLHLVASGGITSDEDVLRLDHMGLFGAIIGKALYEGKIDLSLLLKKLNHAD